MKIISLDAWLELASGASVDELAELAQVHRTTAARWRINGRVPHAVAQLARIHFHGSPPPCAGPAWHGWHFGRDGLLYAPDLARGFSPEDIRCLVWFLQMESWRTARARSVTQIDRAPPGASPPALVRQYVYASGRRVDLVEPPMRGIYGVTHMGELRPDAHPRAPRRERSRHHARKQRI